jgi:hypothetical protein
MFHCALDIRTLMLLTRSSASAFVVHNWKQIVRHEIGLSEGTHVDKSSAPVAVTETTLRRNS